MGSKILTAKVGNNAKLFPSILALYANRSEPIVDATYGFGGFWKDVPPGRYKVWTCDLEPGRGGITADFQRLPFASGSSQMVVLDPPYLYTGGFRTLKDSIDRGYRNRARAERGIHGVPAVHQLYARGFIDAYRVLRKGGYLVFKCMDQVMSGRQVWMHTELTRLAVILGYHTQDLFVLVQSGTPTMRHKTQKHARRNHSYFVVMRK